MRLRALGVLLAVVGLVGLLSAGAGANFAAGRPGGRVLRVGVFRGIPGPFGTIQAAVDAARPGDWILVGPGDYKTTTTSAPTGRSNESAGVLIQTPGLKLRGMNRNTVVVDGTKSGSPCSSAQADQNFGPAVNGKPGGLNGVLVWKADNVSVENLTACNFLGGDGSTGNEIWWNGGDGSGTIGGWGYTGSYLNATSTFYGGEASAAQYGIFSSNWSGGTWDQAYASNFNDSGFYIGACQQQCNQTMDHAWAQFSALGYSGSNSGGRLLVENSQFDHNQDGFDTNSQNGDNPPPQDGACPAGVTPPVAGAKTCWVFVHNYVHDNNNPNVPAAGTAGQSPVGTGMSVSGGRNDTVMDNVFANNDAWGTIVVPYLDSGPPCTGGTLSGGICLFNESGVAVIGNTYANNGSYGNPTNGDIGETQLEPGPSNCFQDNTNTGGTLTTSPPGLQNLEPICGVPGPGTPNTPFVNQVLCNTQISVAACPPGTSYPRQTQVVMHPLPKDLPTMSDPCAGVPNNPWCPGNSQGGNSQGGNSQGGNSQGSSNSQALGNSRGRPGTPS